MKMPRRGSSVPTGFRRGGINFLAFTASILGVIVYISNIEVVDARIAGDFTTDLAADWLQWDDPVEFDQDWDEPEEKESALDSLEDEEDILEESLLSSPSFSENDEAETEEQDDPLREQKMEEEELLALGAALPSSFTKSGSKKRRLRGSRSASESSFISVDDKASALKSFSTGLKDDLAFLSENKHFLAQIIAKEISLASSSPELMKDVTEEEMSLLHSNPVVQDLVKKDLLRSLKQEMSLALLSQSVHEKSVRHHEKEAGLYDVSDAPLDEISDDRFVPLGTEEAAALADLQKLMKKPMTPEQQLFFGKIFRAIKRGVSRVGGFVKKAVNVVKKVGGTVLKHAVKIGGQVLSHAKNIGGSLVQSAMGMIMPGGGAQEEEAPPEQEPPPPENAAPPPPPPPPQPAAYAAPQMARAPAAPAYNMQYAPVVNNQQNFAAANRFSPAFAYGAPAPPPFPYGGYGAAYPPPPPSPPRSYYYEGQTTGRSGLTSMTNIVLNAGDPDNQIQSQLNPDAPPVTVVGNAKPRRQKKNLKKKSKNKRRKNKSRRKGKKKNGRGGKKWKVPKIFDRFRGPPPPPPPPPAFLQRRRRDEPRPRGERFDYPPSPRSRFYPEAELLADNVGVKQALLPVGNPFDDIEPDEWTQGLRGSSH